MAFPSSICYETYTAKFENENVQTQFVSGRTRLRNYGNMNNDIASVSMTLRNSDLTQFKDYFENDAGSGGTNHQGPYFVGGIAKTGLIQIIAGSYDLSYLADGYWRIKYSIRILYRNFTEEQVIYNAVVSNGGFPLP